MNENPVMWKWPLPALLSWSAGWALMGVSGRLGVSPSWALLIGVLPALALMRRAAPGWRRVAVLTGLPLSVWLVQGTAALPAWAWLLACAALLLIYPAAAWRDAPLFPTPRDALAALADVAPLPVGARVLDAGSGLGDGLLALNRAYPHALLQGVEGGRALTWASRARLRWLGCHEVVVVRGDFWRTDWSHFDLIYLFQRPETMPRAWSKASQEMPRGGWLVSLEFEVPGVTAAARLDAGGGRPLWIYRISDRVDSIRAPEGR